MLLDRIEQWAKQQPQRIALLEVRACGEAVQEYPITYGQLWQNIQDKADALKAFGVKGLALNMANSAEWVLVDLAAYYAHIAVVPLPLFFTEEQKNYVMAESGVDAVWDRDGLKRTNNREAYDRHGVAKITFTSGTTGQPKGVVLRPVQIETLCESLVGAVPLSRQAIHLSVNPFSILLENVAGVYTALCLGATVLIPDFGLLGLSGSRGVDMCKWIHILSAYDVHSVITSPELLKMLVAVMKDKKIRLPELRFVAVGGAKVPVALLEEAARVGLPVYEGYGLSEWGSVVTLNTPEAHRLGSVGKALPHVSCRIAMDGEIWIKSVARPSYMHEFIEQDAEGYSPSGDFGYKDEENFLFITGRKKNMYINSYGRNIQPEWIEQALLHSPGIVQAAVFGEGMPGNSAVVFAAHGCDIDQIIHDVNSMLPDYGRVEYVVVAIEPFSLANGQLTANGRPRRDVIWDKYKHQIEHGIKV